MSNELLADQNLIESFRMHARWQAPVEVEEADGMLMIAGANSRPGLYRNCAIRLDSGLRAGEAFDRARTFFGDRARGFVMLTRSRLDADVDVLMKDLGMTPKGQSPCMYITSPLPAGDIPPGVEIVPIRTEQQLHDSVRVNMDAYPMLGLPAEEVQSLFANPGWVLKDEVAGFVAYRNGEPLATALTYISDHSAGIYWVGTAKHAQHQGLAGLCTRFAANAGFDRGARLVTLQASPFGRELYEKLGFQHYDSVRFYFCQP